ncbi:hypothetical protein ACFL5Q_00025 [Planctomycetota bacterium]
MKRFTTSCFILLAVLATVAHADFILWDDEQITVNSHHQEGNLYDTSRADIVAGGEVDELYAHDSSTVNISGGSMGWPSYAYHQSTVTMSAGTMASLFTYNGSRVEVNGGTVTGYLRPYNESSVDISGGSVKYLYVEDSSTVNMSEGSVTYLTAYDSNTLDISGGSVTLLQVLGDTTLNISGGTIDNALHTYGSSIVTLNVKDYRLGGGLTLEGERLLGTGILSGEWMDGTPRWDIDIATNSGAGIFISQVPEPTTPAALSGLLGMGLIGRWWRRRRAA